MALINTERVGWHAVADEAIEDIRADFEEAREKAKEEAEERAKEDGRDPESITEDEIRDCLDFDPDPYYIREYCENTREFSIYFDPAEYATALNWEDIEKEASGGRVSDAVAYLTLERATEEVLDRLKDGEIEGLDL